MESGRQRSLPLEGRVSGPELVEGPAGWGTCGSAPTFRCAGVVEGALPDQSPLAIGHPPLKGEAANSTRATFRYVSISRANQPKVSKLGASGIVPSSEIAPWVVRRPISPQKLAGARIDPPVSEPVAMSARPPATAAAEPDEEPPVMRSGRFGVDWMGEMRVLPHQGEGKFVGLRLAGEARARIKQRLHRRRGSHRRLAPPRRVADCPSRSDSPRRRRYPSRPAPIQPAGPDCALETAACG